MKKLRSYDVLVNSGYRIDLFTLAHAKLWRKNELKPEKINEIPRTVGGP